MKLPSKHTQVAREEILETQKGKVGNGGLGTNYHGKHSEPFFGGATVAGFRGKVND